MHTDDGRTEQIATWNGLPGRSMQLTAATASRRSQIRSVEVTQLDGPAVLSLSL